MTVTGVPEEGLWMCCVVLLTICVVSKLCYCIVLVGCINCVVLTVSCAKLLC